ncbi:hypothetical protein AGE29_03660 [Clostridium botulinum]|uniref:Uncharacterized protein n=2 Tax=Clostridium botulinum TaxID=1491 RepID=A0A846I337_CLOBO|nr:hypothetical protein [Clostridium botulinum]ACQ54364.1 conserved hypothetical protein [Clostridium botulinum Ba4 str. 657]AJE10658.1 hypothetical protein T259_2515 [Clostridium botulinum CDC_1436]AXG90910.1 hypothetical protein AGE29_03660 [Clostridium botulinum]NEZ92674.1 hypothetical protein [Clostridium botulinum]RFM21932.1 hypothetical protein C1146_05365 [Clostridium botulinum]
MNTIGIRSTPSYIYYTIIENEEEYFDIITESKLIVPKALSIPDRLSFIRNCLFSIIQEYNVINAGIRIAEDIISANKERIYIEGVIQELISNSCIEKYFIGNIKNLASLLEETSEDISSYFKNEKVFGDIDEWGNYCKEARESIITAIAAGEL